MKKFKFTINGNVYDAEVLKIEDNIAKVEINGTKYNVEIDRQIAPTKTPKLVRSYKPAGMVPTVEEKSTVAETKLKSPLPGIIVDVLVSEGSVVKKGDRLVVLEAMKMENNIDSPSDGTIKRVFFKKGDSVLEGDILMEIGG
ncbi:MAG: biotin/lipoyl-containing protein [Bacteroidales bacterium]|jgi:biotin carboxyl carrier protein